VTEIGRISVVMHVSD